MSPVTLLDWYREPLFWSFPVGSLIASMVAFAIFATPLTWIAWADPAWARPYRLQSRAPREQQLVGPSIGWWLANNLCLAVATIASWPLLRSDARAGKLLRAAAEELLPEAGRPQDELEQRVRERVRTGLGAGQAELPAVARALHVSPRTLRSAAHSISKQARKSGAT